MFVFNYDYANTGVAASLSKGILGARKYVVSIDGDLLINKEDFYKYIKIIILQCTPINLRQQHRGDQHDN